MLRFSRLTCTGLTRRLGAPPPVASVKSVGSVFAAYYLRKHHSKFWSVPLVANSVISLQGVGQNMATCN